jgi:hypothetical protein
VVGGSGLRADRSFLTEAGSPDVTTGAPARLERTRPRTQNPTWLYWGAGTRTPASTSRASRAASYTTPHGVIARIAVPSGCRRSTRGRQTCSPRPTWRPRTRPGLLTNSVGREQPGTRVLDRAREQGYARRSHRRPWDRRPLDEPARRGDHERSRGPGRSGGRDPHRVRHRATGWTAASTASDTPSAAALARIADSSGATLRQTR